MKVWIVGYVLIRRAVFWLEDDVSLLLDWVWLVCVSWELLLSPFVKNKPVSKGLTDGFDIANVLPLQPHVHNQPPSDVEVDLISVFFEKVTVQR